MKNAIAKLNSKKGFTLMEMLIVVAIIAVLVAIAIPTFSGAITKAQEGADVANIRAAYAEITMKYLTDSTAYPVDDAAFKTYISTTMGVTLNFADKLVYVAPTLADGKITVAGSITYTVSKINNGKAYTWAVGSV